MTTLPPASGRHWLELQRALKAPRERVFRAWTDRDALPSWFAPSPELTVIVHELDLRPGGLYRVELRHPSGRANVVTGAYRSIRPPEKLSFTWVWEGEALAETTLVLVTFQTRGDETELALEHGGFVQESEAISHREAWTLCLDRLEAASG
jgi:uncharacterized protein YndB with AHSA1/START domain